MQLNITKEAVYLASMSAINERILFFTKLLSELNEGAQNDAKSSAGDKHETAMAMMQIEQEKIMKQLHEVNEMKAQLVKLGINQPNSKVILGSLVKTNQGIFYIAAAIGKLIINGSEVYVLSPKSPLAQKIMNLKEKQEIALNKKQYIIEKIV